MTALLIPAIVVAFLVAFLCVLLFVLIDLLPAPAAPYKNVLKILVLLAAIVWLLIRAAPLL